MNEESTVLTIKEGFIKQEIHNLEIHENNPRVEILRIMLAINKANDMWEVTMMMIAFFIVGFIWLFYSSMKPKENVKRYALIYFLCLVVFVVWDIQTHKEILENIAQIKSTLLMK